jgi:flagellar motility protein MotE (MotC chaperone)
VRPAKPGSVTVPPKPAPAQAAVPADNEVALFCSNVADPAVDARLAWQLKELEKAESQLRERIAEVEAKRAEYEKWMALRDDFLKKAEAQVVEIYSRMKPDAAATQIAGMADETAAAVLAKLSPRSSSAIFNEMETARAAHLADLLGGMRRVDDGKTK